MNFTSIWSFSILTFLSFGCFLPDWYQSWTRFKMSDTNAVSSIHPSIHCAQIEPVLTHTDDTESLTKTHRHILNILTRTRRTTPSARRQSADCCVISIISNFGETSVRHSNRSELPYVLRERTLNLTHSNTLSPIWQKTYGTCWDDVRFACASNRDCALPLFYGDRGNRDRGSPELRPPPLLNMKCVFLILSHLKLSKSCLLWHLLLIW